MADTDRFPALLGGLFRRHRLSRDWTQAEVASAVGLTQPMYSNYERGQVLPTVPVLVALINELGIEAGEVLALLDDDPEPEPANGAEVAA